MAHRPLPSDGEPAAPPADSEPAADLQCLGVVAALNEGVVIQRADGVIESCNPAAERILGLSAEQMMGRSSVDPRWRSVHEDGPPFPGEDHPAMVTLRTGRPLRDVIMGVHKPDGSLTWISVDSMVLRDADHPAGLAVFTSFTDITERRAAEQREHALLEGLERRAAELQAANQDLDHFAAAVAHDLRAPLRAIVGFLRVLDEADHIASDDAEGRALITRVTKAAARMGELIDALLELARSEAKRRDLAYAGLRAVRDLSEPWRREALDALPFRAFLPDAPPQPTPSPAKARKARR